MLDLKDALDLLDTGQWVSIAYVSYDEKRGTAGNIIRLKRCRLLTGEASNTSPRAAGTQSVPIGRKNPNHYDHATRNVKLANGQLRKFHIRLLFAINNKKIL